MNLLSIVNKVLVRLREEQVTSVNDNPYSQLIVEFINTTKREVEDAWEWYALKTEYTFNTTTSVSKYPLVNSETRAKIKDVINLSTREELEYKPEWWFTEKMKLDTPETGEPKFYTFKSVDANGDLELSVYPVPDTSYSILVDLIKPQNDLSLNTDVLLVPYRIVIEGAVSKAISERGDDGGYTEQENRYILSLGDAIANEANLRPEEITWGAT